MIKIIDLFRTLLAIIAKYGFLISLRYVLLEMFMNKILLWKNVRVNDWTAELVIIVRNG